MGNLLCPCIERAKDTTSSKFDDEYDIDNNDRDFYYYYNQQFITNHEKQPLILL